MNPCQGPDLYAPEGQPPFVCSLDDDGHGSHVAQGVNRPPYAVWARGTGRTFAELPEEEAEMANFAVALAETGAVFLIEEVTDGHEPRN